MNNANEGMTSKDAHIVRFMGGLGNQLFQYALYKTFAGKGFATYADLSFFREWNEIPRNYQLPFLGIKVAEAPTPMIRRYYRSSGNFLVKALVNKLGGGYFKQKELFFDNRILAAKRGYFDGYWQSQKFFAGYEDEVRKGIKFLNDDNDELARRIANDHLSVSIHVRLGDYLKYSARYGGICTQGYYQQAMRVIAGRVSQTGSERPHFYVFSNDAPMAKGFLGNGEFVFVEGHSEEEGYKDLRLMSLCRHHVIAHSSFSWWGAFLNERADTIVTAPSRWVNGLRADDVIPDRWIKIAAN